MATKVNPFTFLQQVRSEVSKVVWPTRREAVITTIMVFVMAIAASAFFTLADFVLSWGVQLLLGVGR
jgi:preprotein translocase subunit SecE